MACLRVGPAAEHVGELLVRASERIPEPAEHIRPCSVDETRHHREAELVPDVGEWLNVGIERLEVAEVTFNGLSRPCSSATRRNVSMQAPDGWDDT